MTSIVITVGISMGLLFTGLLGGYVIAEQIYSPRNMMNNDPQTTTQWMSTMMETMMNDPGLRHQMINQMIKNPQFLNDVAQNNQMMNMLKSDMIDQGMNEQDIMSTMMASSKMTFNPDVPITIPMIDGYYNGEKIYFIHTELSDEKMADMMTSMVNFPTLYVPDLENIPDEDIGKFYVFTNGVTGTGPYGGGPFMFQIDIFDSIPGQDEYGEYRIPQLVTWNNDSTPRVLTSVSELLDAKAKGELSIKSADFVVHLPMIVWDSGTKQQAEQIKKPFVTMPEFDAKVINIDEDNYTVTLQFNPTYAMNMMN